jgi:SEC-C motif domain protein
MAENRGQERCMCLSGEQYGQCCGRFHSGAAEAGTAEQLMRSRYSAFFLLDAGYLLRTWHPETAPAELPLDPAMEWRRLDVLSAFKAHYRDGNGRGVLHEVSRFARENGRWYYLDGEVLA